MFNNLLGICCTNSIGKEGEQMDNRFMRAEEVADVLGISVSFAYKIVRKLNAELKEKGFITGHPKGI